MKLLIIGGNGQLGFDMTSLCRARRHEVRSIDFPTIDITNQESIQKNLQNFKPEIIINCSAYTQVDLCEQNQQIAYEVNAQGVENIALSAQAIKAAVVHFSTDYVFDGLATKPYRETDITNPLSIYGKSKLAGEKKLSTTLENYYIFRLAWLYGSHGNNFVKTICKRAMIYKDENKPLKVVNDQMGTPSFTKDICLQVLTILQHKQFGLYHCTSQGACSWYDFARFIINQANINVDIIPCSSAEYVTPAPRPGYSVLQNYNLQTMNADIMPLWQDSVQKFFNEYTI